MKTLPASRVGKYCRTVDDYHKGKRVYPADLSRAVVELVQLIPIVDHLSEDAKLEDVLRRVLKGEPHPWNQSSQDDHPWDYQAELFLAARLRSVGIEAWLEEPSDVRTIVRGTEARDCREETPTGRIRSQRTSKRQHRRSVAPACPG